MRSGLRRLRARTAGDLRHSEDGFTLIEMMVAISILAVTMIAIAYGLFGGMSVMQAARNKTSMLELANAEAEKVRALDYATAGVNGGTADGTAPDPDPNLNAAYPPVAGVNKFRGRDAVVINPPTASTPPAVEVVTSSSSSNRPTPYTIRRWVTWTDPAAGTTQRFKRIDIRIEWNDAGGTPREVEYSTLFYPGNLGRLPGSPPTATFTPSPTSGFRTTTSFAFTATATDPEGLSLVYAWDFGDGETSTDVSPTHTYATVGRKTVSLVVTNSDGQASSPATQNVLVGTAPGIPAPPGNVAPVAAFTATPILGPGPLSVNVDAAATTDINGDPLTFQWNWGDASTLGAGVSAGHSYPDFGTFTITLTVVDPAGYSSSASQVVNVTSSSCRLTTASFKNPGTNTVNNEIDTRNNSNRPVNSQFVFSASTSSVCTGVTGRIPTQTGTFAVTLVLASSTAATKTWALTTSDNSKYTLGNTQSATFTATAPAPATPVNLTISFRVF